MLQFPVFVAIVLPGGQMQGNLGGPAAAVACVFASLPVRFEGIAITSLQIRQKESLGQWKNFGSSGISLRLLPRETC